MKGIKPAVCPITPARLFHTISNYKFSTQNLFFINSEHIDTEYTVLSIINTVSIHVNTASVQHQCIVNTERQHNNTLMAQSITERYKYRCILAVHNWVRSYCLLHCWLVHCPVSLPLPTTHAVQLDSGRLGQRDKHSFRKQLFGNNPPSCDRLTL